MITVEEAHEEIAATYRWFADQNPLTAQNPYGVKVVEQGRLSNLWAFVDQHTNPETGEEYE